jgi:hypothetical protein
MLGSPHMDESYLNPNPPSSALENVLIVDWLAEELDAELLEATLLVEEALLALEDPTLSESEATLLELDVVFLPLFCPHQKTPANSPITASVPTTLINITLELSSLVDEIFGSISGPLV